MDTEEEIKIEYYEDFDQDPLKEPRLKVNVPDSITLKNTSNNQCSELDAQLLLTNNNKDEIFSTEDVQYQYDISTWYNDTSKKYICNFCKQSYFSTQVLSRHLKSKHPLEAKILDNNKRKPKHKCHICKTIFTDISKLEQHFLNHTLKTCQIENTKCDKTENKVIDKTDNSSNCSQITKISKRLKCPYCPQILSKKYSLNLHILTRHKSENEYKYQCSYCSYKAPVKYYLVTHIASKHKYTEYAKTQPKNICQICGYSTIRKSHFEKHKKLHSNSKTFKCAFCEYNTVCKHNLTVHERVHTKEKPYKCDFKGCLYECSTQSGVKNHKLLHSKEKHYIYCDKCCYKTIYKQSLQRHYVTHTKVLG